MLSLAVIFLLRKTIHFVESHMHVVMACVYSYNACVVVYSYNACVSFDILIQCMCFVLVYSYNTCVSFNDLMFL